MLQQGLLHVHPVLRLLEDAGLRALEHLLGDLLAPVRGQAVEHHRARPAPASSAASTVKPRKACSRAAASASCPMLVHTSVTTTSAPATRLARVPGDDQVPPGGLRPRAGGGRNPGGAASCSVKSNSGAASTNERAMLPEPSPTKAMRRPATRAEALLDGEEVGQHLHRVAAVGEPVDDRHRAPAHELARAARRRWSASPPRRRRRRRPARCRTVARPGPIWLVPAVQLDGVAAELERGRGEGQPRPGARLLHQQHHRLPGERVSPRCALAPAPLELRGAGEQPPDLPAARRSVIRRKCLIGSPRRALAKSCASRGTGAAAARASARGLRSAAICRSTSAGPVQPALRLPATEARTSPTEAERRRRAPGRSSRASSSACRSPQARALRLADQRAHPAVRGPERHPRPDQRLGHVGRLGVVAVQRRPAAVGVEADAGDGHPQRTEHREHVGRGARAAAPGPPGGRGCSRRAAP